MDTPVHELLGHWAGRALQAEPPVLERAVRGLLIHLHYHLSDKQAIVRSGAAAGGAQPLIMLTPALFKGQGRIEIDADVMFGVVQSAGAWSPSYFEARTATSRISIGRGCVFNNRTQVVSDGAGVHFGQRCLVGPEMMVYDSNFHGLPVAQRMQTDSAPQETVIGDDVLVGARVTVLKGARIGAGSVLAAGAVVTPGFVAPPGSIVAGNPARVVGSVPAA